MGNKVFIKITSERNFQFGAKLFGREGIYEVDEDTARAIVDSGRAEVHEGEISQKPVSAFVDQQGKQSFLNMVRECSTEIINILENEHNRPPADKAPAGAGTGTGEESNSTATNEEANTDKVASEEVGDNKGSTEKNELTPIPDAFPGKKELEDAGITNIEDIPQDKEELSKLGINTRTANLIGSKLAQG